ncbi:hypothetical protein ACVWXO_008131 [Bradyrhizobium sp. LM2.7]
MRPVDQTQFYEEGKSHGNCQQAATASLLGLDLGDVPNFIEHPHGFWQSFWEFMGSRGLVVIELSGHRHFDCYHLAYGPSPRGVSHAVVYRYGALAHDPHPSRAGLLSVETTALVIPVALAGWKGPPIKPAQWGSARP